MSNVLETDIYIDHRRRTEKIKRRRARTSWEGEEDIGRHRGEEEGATRKCPRVLSYPLYILSPGLTRGCARPEDIRNTSLLKNYSKIAQTSCLSLFLPIH